MDILNNLGMTQDTLDQATGEVKGEFKPLPAGAYKATVKQILVYTNNFKDRTMHYVVNITEHDRDIRFMKDVSATLKDKTPNGGYANRFKQFMYAANTEESACSIKEKAAKLNSFGKEYECDEIIGMVGKNIIAEILLMDDINKQEGASYKYQNALSGVLALDGTDASGEDKLEDFVKRCTDKPTTAYEGYVKPGNTTAVKADPAATQSAESEGF